MKITYFLHGLDSSGSGTKGRYFQKNYPKTRCPDFHGPLRQRLTQFEALCEKDSELQLIGSSYGGLMATCYAITNPEKVGNLILLAPALNFENFHPPSAPLQVPTLLIVGNSDTVTPMESVVPLARKTFASLQVEIVDDDHLLHNYFPKIDWSKLLESYGAEVSPSR